MPVKFPIYNLKEDPRRTLVHFVEAVRDFLSDIVEDNRDSFGERLFIEELRDDITGAWHEAGEHFSVAVKHVADASLERLHANGLVGAQLRLKTRIVQYFARRYEEGGRRFLKPLLDVIDDLLDSVLDAIPGGHAVSEIKDAIKNSVGD